MDETRLIRSLRSVRRFDSRPIPQDVLGDILEAARWTGSGKNSQPWRLVAVRDRETLAALSRCGQFAFHLEEAPAAIVLSMDDADHLFDEGRLAQNIQLGAWAHGVGSCIASFFPGENIAAARELLGVPEERSCHTAISLGYPADVDALRIPPGFESVVPRGRMPLTELVGWERYGEPRS
jgi:nitroreductase